MCGRFSLIADLQELGERFGFDPGGLTHPPQVQRRPNPAGAGRDERGRKTCGAPALGPDPILGEGCPDGQPDDQCPCESLAKPWSRR